MTQKLKQIIRAFIAIAKGQDLTVTNVNLKTAHPSQILSEKTILVTGGSSGIGKAIAKACLASGAKVIITGRNETKLQKTKNELQLLSQSIYTLNLDISEICGLADIPQKIRQLTGTPINVLVNNAGIAKGNFENLKEDEFSAVVDTNLKGTVFLTKSIAEDMILNEIQGNILNIISSSGNRPALSAYELSKWSLRGFTLGLAKKLIKKGIVVNGIAPGPTATPMLKADDDKNLYHPTNPSGRFTTPDEIANLAVFLISDMGRQIVGDIVYMTGGAAVTTFDDIKY